MGTKEEDLEQKIADLEGKLGKAAEHEQNLQEEIATLRSKIVEANQRSETSGRSGMTAPPTPGPTAFYVQRERKLPTFAGPPKESAGLEAEEWVLDMRAHLATRTDLPETKKAGIVLDQLEGRPRREMRHRGDECTTPEGIFKVVLDLFSKAGVGTTVSGLKEKFFMRRQGAEESVLDYSHSLLQLQSQVKARDPKRPILEAELKERFAAGLRESQLRRDLLRLVEEDATLSYMALRDKAIQWSRGEAVPVRTSSKEEKVTPPEGLVEEITRRIRAELQLADKATAKTSKKKRTLKCYQCGDVGHFKRNCPKRKTEEGKKQGN
jgi:hypothetical protein